MTSIRDHRSIVEAVFAHAVRTPEKTAVADPKGSCTYSRLREHVLHAAACLRAAHLCPGDRLVLECSQDARFLAVNLACSIEGVIFVGVERRVAEGRLDEIIRQIDPALVVTLRPNAQIKKRCCTLNDFWETVRCGTDAATPGKTPDPETVCEILFSTGTTGKSKGAMLSNRANLACAQNIVEGAHYDADTVELMPLPLNHAHGLRTAYAHLLNGSTCVIANGITMPRVVLNMMDQYGVNALDLTPSAAQMLMHTSWENLRSRADRIRFVEVGAAFLPEGTKADLRACFPASRLYNFYGSSEAGRCCVLDFAAVTDKPGCIGKPVPNAHFAVLGPDGAPISSDHEHTGVLACGGSMVMSGYWMEPELTAQTLQNGNVVTADLSYIDEDGYIFVLGRVDDVINYRGVKISPEEIEEAANACELVADSACVPEADTLAGQVPKLYVVLKEGLEDMYTPEKLFAFLKERIEANRMPRTIEVINEIPRTYNGKLQRKKLMQ